MTALERCIQILEISNATIEESLTTITHSLKDHPRLFRVLETARQYELLSEEEILQAKLDVQREVEPQIRELISRSESGLQGLQRRERSAHAKAERSRASPAVLTLASAPKKQANSAYSAEVAKLRARLMALQTQKENTLKAADKAEEELQSRKGSQ